MARVGTWIIHTQQPGRPEQTYLFNTSAQSEAQAIKHFRQHHKRWKILGVQAPLFSDVITATPVSRPKGRKR